MSFNASRFSRMRSAFSSWKRKIDDEREESKRLAEEKAEQELAAAEAARELAKKTASIASTTSYSNTVATLKTDIDNLVTKINTELTAIDTLVTAQSSITTSADMDTNLNSIISQNALIVKDFDTLVNKMALIEAAYESAKDASDDDYSETTALIATAFTNLTAAQSSYNSVLDAKVDSQAAVTNTTKAYNSLVVAEQEAARVAAALSSATTKVTEDLTILGTYVTTATSYETAISAAKATADTNYNTVQTATESTGLNVNLTDIISQATIITEKVSLLSDLKATAEALYGTLVKTAGDYESLSDELATALSNITSIRNNYTACVGAKPAVDTQIANATTFINDLKTSEAEVAAQAAAAAAQAAAEAKAAQAAADAQAALDAERIAAAQRLADEKAALEDKIATEKAAQEAALEAQRIASEAQIAILEDSMLAYNEVTTAPSGGNGTMWFHPTNNKLYQKQNNAWVQIAPGVGGISIYDVNGTKVN